MKRVLIGALALVPVWAIAATVARAEEHTRWIHVRVVSKEAEGETVRVNVPVEFAEQVLPAIHSHELQDGKVKIHGNVEGVDFKQLYEAIRNTPDNEFVTVQQKDRSEEHTSELQSLAYLVC